MKKFGCILFDLTEQVNGKRVPNTNSGWASIEGESSFRVRKKEDLDQNVIWWTNLDKQIFWKSGAVLLNNYKYSNFFKTSLGQIIKELDISPKDVTTAKTVEYLSNIFNKSIQFCIEHYNLTEADLEKQSLSDMLYEHLVSEEDKNLVYENEILEIMTKAYQDIVVCDNDNDNINSDNKITLKIPRLYHAKQILSSMLPSGNWEIIGEDDLPSHNEDRKQLVLNYNRPLLVKVKLKKNMPKLLNLGDAIGFNKRKAREWLCLPEYLYFSKFVDLEITSVCVAEGYKSLNTPYELLEIGPLSSLSITLALIAENHWFALSSKRRHKINRNTEHVSADSVWLRATDRFYTFSIAQVFEQSGFNVVYYGNGSVSIIFDKKTQSFDNLKELCEKLNLLIPTITYKEMEE